MHVWFYFRFDGHDKYFVEHEKFKELSFKIFLDQANF